MLGLARAISSEVRTIFVSFGEGGLCRSFLHEAARCGFESLALDNDTPHFRAAIGELVDRLSGLSIDVLFCHGYKASLLGRPAARRAGIPVVGVSRGWTYESLKVRIYELLDRINLRWMDRVVCVSEGQAAKVRRLGVPARKVVIIPNAIDSTRFEVPDPTARMELERLFRRPIRHVVGAAGRLSPEKGFSVLVEAAEQVARSAPDVGFVLFGEGVLRPALAEQIAVKGLSDRFILAGFRPDLDRLLPRLDLLVQSSYTEGMPNVVLEACAAGVPVVATAVGGTPEIIDDGVNGHLIATGRPGLLAQVILKTLADEAGRNRMGRAGRQIAGDRFTFEAQARSYRTLLHALKRPSSRDDDPVVRDMDSLTRR